MRRYILMHGSREVAGLTEGGACEILCPDFMPYSLYLEEQNDMDGRVQNMINFYAWCSSRTLTLDRQYIKEILNSIGATQAATDQDRAKIALSYHCLSLTDIYWVRQEEETVTWEELNLYENHLSNAFVDLSLRGKQMTATNRELAPDLSTSGCFPKAWVRREDGFFLLKDGGADAVEREVLASRVCRCFDCSQVLYEQEWFEGQPVSVSRIFTDPKRGIVTREAFEIYAANHDLDAAAFIKKMDPEGYYSMYLLDYLTGNTDRHWGNWGFLVDHADNRLLCLHPLMDFNRAFTAYDQPDGGVFLPEFSRHISQREAALEAVRAIGWPQIRDMEPEWFAGHRDWYEMLTRRMELLRK